MLTHDLYAKVCAARPDAVVASGSYSVQFDGGWYWRAPDGYRGPGRSDTEAEAMILRHWMTLLKMWWCIGPDTVQGKPMWTVWDGCDGSAVAHGNTPLEALAESMLHTGAPQ